MRRLVALFAAVAALEAAGAQTAPPPTGPGSPPPSSRPAPAVSRDDGSLEAIPPALVGEALTVVITAIVGRPSEPPVWEARDVKYTLPGASVAVKMVGSEVAVLIKVTPYKTTDGKLLLVAQSQVWYKDGDKGLRYRTTMDTITVAFGERVYFYPFGAPPREAAQGAAASGAESGEASSPLRIELVIDGYRPGAASPLEAEAAKEKTVP